MSSASLLLATAVALLAAPLPAADWPCWRGPHHNGVVPTEELRTDWPRSGPPIAWRAQVGTGFSSVVVVAGRAYTLGHRDGADRVVCLNAGSGEVLWEHGYPAELDPNLFEGGPTATPAIDRGRLFTFSRQGLAISWDAATGREQWRTDVPRTCGVNVPSWGFAGSPRVLGDLVLLNAGSGGVALDGATGRVVWKSDNSDDAAYATPRVVPLAGRPTALILSGKALHAVDPQSGREFWQHRWLTRYGVNAADPLVVGDLVWLTSGYSKGSALLRATPHAAEELWRNRELRNQMSPGVVIDGRVYAVDGDENAECLLKCLDYQTGDLRWQAGGLGAATLIASGDTLILLGDKGELVLARASPEEFQPLARGAVLTGKCWTPPSLAGGRIYCRNAEGEVVCVDLR
jgi:outer membrane protein assembly factor BamB